MPSAFKVIPCRWSEAAMRAALVFSPLVAAVASVSAFAQAVPYAAVVADPEVKLRAGPSDKYPVTSSLFRGNIVVVDREPEDGWLAIKPPVGSVSWVPSQFLEGFDPNRPLPQNVQVRCEGKVTLAAGQVGVPQPLDIRLVSVPDGTLLVVIGAKVTYQNKTWFPVMPPDGDYRFLPKSAVKAGPAVNETFVVAGGSSAKPNAPSVSTSPTLSLPGVQPASLPDGTWSRPSGINDPLWIAAEKAENEGRLEEAEKLFFQLARKMNEPGGDHDVANQCYSRIHSLREKKRLTQPTSTANAPSSSSNPSSGTITPVSSRPDDRSRSRTAGSGSQSTSSPPPSSNPPREDDPKTGEKWTGAGFLVRTGYSLDGKTTYALESAPRIVRYYVLEGPGVDLKKYINRRVDLFGTVTTRRDVAQHLITVTSVEPASEK
jgi:hypothetical protein